jgi:two-component system response regulator YesN
MQAMYKAVIVDDEEEVRTGIVNKIDWELFDFRISGQAENGQEALDMVEEDIPDVVITDITMPLMDGLKLTCELRERYPTVKTVILTGFDDFKFAQQAIKYGVSDYLLKPVLPADIHELMSKLKLKLDAETAQREDIERLRRHYAESLPVMREKFLSSLLSGNVAQAEAQRRIAEYGLRLHGIRFGAASAKIDATSLASGAFAGDGELAKVAVLNAAREILDRQSFGEAFHHEGNIAILAAFDNAGTAAVNRMISALEEIRQTVGKYLKVTVTIGMGSILTGAGRIRQSYGEALSALEYSVIQGGNRVIYLEDVEIADETVRFDEGKERLLASSMKYGTEEQVSEAMDMLFGELSDSKASSMDYQLYLMEMLAAAARVARAFGIDLSGMLGDRSGMHTDMFGFHALAEAKSWFRSLCTDIMRRIAAGRQNSAEVLMQKAGDYIDANFSDNELSIQKLADHLHISACYLSMILRKEAGETFLKRLVRVRLEAAKELLRNTDLKSTEIAERIGYPDINYFSYFFKKNFGMSPREYRSYVKSREGRGE